MLSASAWGGAAMVPSCYWLFVSAAQMNTRFSSPVTIVFMEKGSTYFKKLLIWETTLWSHHSIATHIYPTTKLPRVMTPFIPQLFVSGTRIHEKTTAHHKVQTPLNYNSKLTRCFYFSFLYKDAVHLIVNLIYFFFCLIYNLICSTLGWI